MIDTCMINFVHKSKPKEMKDLFYDTPVRYIPFFSDGEYVICDVVANEANSPSNSVFGPRGVICPGNIMTLAMVKAMMEMMNHFDYKVEGTPKYGGESVMDVRICNLNELKIIL